MTALLMPTAEEENELDGILEHLAAMPVLAAPPVPDVGETADAKLGVEPGTGDGELLLDHLTAHHRSIARKRIVRSWYVGLNNAAAMHYTEGPLRWSGIHDHRRAYKGQFPIDSDCSAFGTWGYWDGTLDWHLADIVNGERWLAGYTGTMLDHGVDVGRDAAAFLPGDLVIYNGHVAGYVGAGRVISHGSEAGPFLLGWEYRPDVVSVRRYLR